MLLLRLPLYPPNRSCQTHWGKPGLQILKPGHAKAQLGVSWVYRFDVFTAALRGGFAEGQVALGVIHCALSVQMHSKRIHNEGITKQVDQLSSNTF